MPEAEAVLMECLTNTHLKLDDSVDQEINVLKEIFVHRSYSDYFPFYEKAIIVDVGAHYGYFTLFAAVNSHQESSIFSLEPSQDNYKILLQNIAVNHFDNIKTLNLGIDAKSGKQSFYLSKSKNHSIFSKKQYELSSSVPTEISVITLKELLTRLKLSHIDFLKIDCEGAEYPALFNTTPGVFRKIKTISMEFHDLKDPRCTGLAMILFLKKQGYEIVKFTHEASRRNLNYGKIIATRL